MFKKMLLSIALVGSFCVTAADMDAEGFRGSFELKYNQGDLDGGLGDFTYRARAGWRGTANDMIKWGFALSTKLNTQFSGNTFRYVGVEQAWLRYSPMRNFMIKFGKFNMHYSPHIFGVLYSDDYFAEGVVAKYLHRVNKGTKVYVTASHTDMSDDDSITRITVGLKNRVNTLNVHAGLGIEGNALTADKPTNFGRGYLSIGTQNMGIPVGVFGMLSTDVDAILEETSYTAGVWFGKANAARDFSVHVSYYDISSASWHTDLVDIDYISEEGTGVNARVQYNLFDNSNIVAKYNLGMGDDSSDHSLIGELTVNF